MTDFILTEPEVRVLGSLVEKEITTPDYYPLSLNALINACNQKTNREPVVSYDECATAAAAEELRKKGLVILTGARDSRVPKFDNYFADTYHLTKPEVAIMCVLMLRGPQTVGELRTRTERMYEFSELEEVEAVLNGLAAREEGALVVKLSRQPGQKESRFAHLLMGEIAVDSAEPAVNHTAGLCSELERIERLERELAELKEQFADFKKQFE